MRKVVWLSLCGVIACGGSAGLGAAAEGGASGTTSGSPDASGESGGASDAGDEASTSGGGSDAAQATGDASSAPDAAASADAGAKDVSCDTRALRCKAAETPCPEGQVHEIVDGCYGACVPIATCACDGPDACPHSESYTCWNNTDHCGPYVN